MLPKRPTTRQRLRDCQGHILAVWPLTHYYTAGPIDVKTYTTGSVSTVPTRCLSPPRIDLPGFADGWGGYRVVHYDQSTDPKLSFHIGRRHTSRTTSRTCRFGPETPFQAATHSENPETQHALYRLQQCVCWPRGSLGSGPQLGSCLGSLGRRPRGRSRPLTAAAA